jgi:hypothetical protein
MGTNGWEFSQAIGTDAGMFCIWQPERFAGVSAKMSGKIKSRRLQRLPGVLRRVLLLQSPLVSMERFSSRSEAVVLSLI